MKYEEKIKELIEHINDEGIMDLESERKRGIAPTQVSLDYLMNKEQGEWAEKTLLNALNNSIDKYIAVKYSKKDNILAGEEGFKEFYNDYQDELDSIGKRPDILIFKKDDLKNITTDISELPQEELDKLVPKAICGLEVRSSNYLIEKYEKIVEGKNKDAVDKALKIKDKIIKSYSTLLSFKNKELFNIINDLNEENIYELDFRCPSWKSTTKLEELSKLFKDLKDATKKMSKKTNLSITLKAEDLKVIHTWIKKYNIPHYYIQVYLDKAYGISYEDILMTIYTRELEGEKYTIERDEKNPDKTTIKININDETNILDKIKMPEHYSEMRELDKGKVQFNVKFKSSKCELNKSGIKSLLGVDL